MDIKKILAEAEKGNTAAQVTLGKMFLKGQGVPQSFEQARVWLQKARDAGSEKAIFYIGQMHQLGMGCASNAEIALQHYEWAAKKGSHQASQHLANLYNTGELVKKNQQTAYFWANIATMVYSPTGTSLVPPIDSPKPLRDKLLKKLDRHTAEMAQQRAVDWWETHVLQSRSTLTQSSAA